MAEFAQKAARKAAAPRRGPIRLGMMRHLLVAIDCSEAMTSQDLKPMRFLCTLKVSGFAYTSVVLYVLPPLCLITVVRAVLWLMTLLCIDHNYIT